VIHLPITLYVFSSKVKWHQVCSESWPGGSGEMIDGLVQLTGIPCFVTLSLYHHLHCILQFS